MYRRQNVWSFPREPLNQIPLKIFMENWLTLKWWGCTVSREPTPQGSSIHSSRVWDEQINGKAHFTWRIHSQYNHAGLWEPWLWDQERESQMGKSNFTMWTITMILIWLLQREREICSQFCALFLNVSTGLPHPLPESLRMSDQALPTLEHLAIQELASNERLAISVVEDLPKVFFPPLFKEAFIKRRKNLLSTW